MFVAASKAYGNPHLFNDVVLAGLDGHEHERAADRVANHQANNSNIAEHERDELAHQVFDLVAGGLALPVALPVPRGPFSLHAKRGLVRLIILTLCCGAAQVSSAWTGPGSGRVTHLPIMLHRWVNQECRPNCVRDAPPATS